MKWEYKTIKINATGFFGVDFNENEATEYMNKLGRTGWELVSAFDTNGVQGNTLHIVLIFKRPLAE